MQKFHINKLILNNNKPNIFMQFSVFALMEKSLNFGQGFPNFDIPDFMKTNVTQGLEMDKFGKTDFSFGTELFLKTVSEEYTRRLGRDIDWKRNIVVGSGGTSILSHLYHTLKEQDEIIVMEPFFPWYNFPIKMSKGKLKQISLKYEKNSFNIDFEALKKTLNSNTKYVIFNSPHNPTGKVFINEDFEQIREILVDFPNCIIICDEVYEMTFYNQKKFPRIQNYKDLYDKTISIHSGGKTFACTGWRVGWAIGPEELITPLKEVQKVTSYQTNTEMMNIMAETMIDAKKEYKNHSNYYTYLLDFFGQKKQKVIKALQNSKMDFKVIEPDGGYFVLCDITNAIKKVPIAYFYKQTHPKKSKNMKKFLNHYDEWLELKDVSNPPDVALCIFLTKKYKVTPIPCNKFFGDEIKNPDKYRFIRFAICKKAEDIENLPKLLP